MCSLHLTHPSSGQPGEQSWIPAGAGIRTHNLGLPRVSSPTLYPLGQRLPFFNYLKNIMLQLKNNIKKLGDLIRDAW